MPSWKFIVVILLVVWIGTFAAKKINEKFKIPILGQIIEAQ